VAELEHLRDAYGVNVVMFADETPTLDGKRWERILDLLIERKVGTKILMETRVDDIIRDEHIMDKYRRAEVDHIYVGVEATTQAALDTFNKNIKVEDSKRALDLINAQDIVSETSFVLGMPMIRRRAWRRRWSWQSITIPTWRSSWPSHRGPTRRSIRR